MTEARETALNSISEAFDQHSLPLDLVEPPAPATPQMTPQLPAHAVCILGATQDPQARPLIEPLLRHPDPDVREEARRAAAEITAPKPEGRVHKS
ncbi:HEAT repeat domain-containing protein [Streptomyces atratus]